MTNKEIEKRFEFDLNMGLFKSNTSRENISYIIVSKNDNSYKILCRILNKIGYKYFKLRPIITGNNILSIAISPNRKIYRESIYSSRYPKLPDYTMEYSLRKRWFFKK